MTTNTLLTPSVITKETLMILENNLVAAGKVNRQFENQFVKIGQSLTIRKPNKFLVTTGPGLSLQNITEPQTSITISNQKHIDFQFTSADLTLTIEEFSERYCKPAAVKLANQIDFDVLTNYTSFSNLVGTSGTNVNTFALLSQASQRLDENAAPQDGRVLIITPAANWALAGAFNNLFVTRVSESALKGYLANIANFEIYMDQNMLQSHTWGNFAGSGQVNSANQTGSSIVTNNWTASRTLFLAGDVVTFAGVFAVNPENLQSTGALKNFLVTATVTSDGSGNATIPISPALTTSGAFQTASASPANLAAVSQPTSPSANTAYFSNLAFTRDALGLVTVPMIMPDGVDFKAQETWKGIMIRIIRDFDINNDALPTRLDVLYGTAVYYDELGVRLTN